MEHKKQTKKIKKRTLLTHASKNENDVVTNKNSMIILCIIFSVFVTLSILSGNIFLKEILIGGGVVSLLYLSGSVQKNKTKH